MNKSTQRPPTPATSSGLQAFRPSELSPRTRRQFLRDTALLAPALLLAPNLPSATTAATPAPASGAAAPTRNQKLETRNSGGASGAPALRVFIVTDAHFGWEDPKQPTPAAQRRAIAAIRRRFPDLDLMLDTGDPHHNGPNHARDTARSDWADIIMLQPDPIPFHYIPGNHDIAHANDCDPEFRCNTLGSHEARPYYSFDMKNIHFISVPQLTHTVLTSRETLEWLRLDMELNKTKTTILLAHNNLTGYSKTNEPGYREIVNTREIIALMNAYPNCVAWMYGHNHNYEFLAKNGKLYIANGRIGGFDPSKGKHGLGGIHIEITPDRVDFRAYSAEFGKFVTDIDPADKTPYAATLNIPTSLDPAAPPAHSAGVGMARDGEKSPIYHHFVPATTPDAAPQLTLAGVAGAVLNEDPNFTMFTVRKTGKTTDRQLMGCSIKGNREDIYDWKNPGLLMRPSTQRHVMTLPRTNHNLYCHYRAPAAKNYQVALDLQGNDGGGQTITIRAKLHDRQGQQIAATMSQHTLTGERQQITCPFAFPAKKLANSIYTDETSDNIINLSVEIEFDPSPKSTMLHRVAIGFAGATAQTDRPAITIAPTTSGAPGTSPAPAPTIAADATLAPGEYRSFTLPPRASSRSVATIAASGNGLATWHYRLPNIEWQILGAPVSREANTLHIGPMRNPYTHRKEIAITPLTDHRTKTYVSRLRNIDTAEITPGENASGVSAGQITIKITKLLTAAAAIADTAAGADLEALAKASLGAASGRPEIEIYSPRADLKISGGEAAPARQPAGAGNKYIIPVAEGATITII